MNTEKFIPLAKGIIKKIFVRKKYATLTGGTDNSRYCYSVWMRHFVFANNNGIKNLQGTIAELGPGDSMGIGLTALLTGFSRYYALDVFKYWDIERNVKMLDELVTLLKNRTPIPSGHEFPRVIPALEDYSFPSHILTDEILEKTLSEERIETIRNEILSLEKQDKNKIIKYFIPWNDRKIIENNSVDFILSQAVLQYIDDLDSTYATMHEWLKQGGTMSHSIDFSSHGITRSWNGHWTFTEAEWKLVHGNNKILLNRAPRSEYLKLNKKYNFEIISKMDYEKESRFTNRHFSKKFRDLLPGDIKTFVAVIQSRKLALIPLLIVS
jgi:SAM-dependent methyltransferase